MGVLAARDIEIAALESLEPARKQHFGRRPAKLAPDRADFLGQDARLFRVSGLTQRGETRVEPILEGLQLDTVRTGRFGRRRPQKGGNGEGGRR